MALSPECFLDCCWCSKPRRRPTPGNVGLLPSGRVLCEARGHFDPPQLAAFSCGSCPRYAGELLEEFKAAMLARPQHTNWTKALASWTCPPQTGSCDDICGDGVSRAAPASCCLCTAAAQTTDAVEGGHHRLVPLAAAVVGVGACRLPRPAAELRQVWGEPTS